MQAKVIRKQGRMTPNGREGVYEVRAGAAGAGRRLGKRVVFWPWSSPSVEAADRLVQAQADSAGVTQLTWQTPDDLE